MTRKEWERGADRLLFLEKNMELPDEIIRDLKDWWLEKLPERKKIIPFDPRGCAAKRR